MHVDASNRDSVIQRVGNLQHFDNQTPSPREKSINVTVHAKKRYMPVKCICSGDSSRPQHGLAVRLTDLLLFYMPILQMLGVYAALQPTVCSSN